MSRVLDVDVPGEAAGVQPTHVGGENELGEVGEQLGKAVGFAAFELARDQGDDAPMRTWSRTSTSAAAESVPGLMVSASSAIPSR